jgi:hypothetical protein
MRLPALILVGLAAPLIASCAAIRDFHAANPDFGSTVPPYERIQFASQFATADEKARCEEAGGTVERAGRAGWERCVQTYPDAGKACTGSADCLGECRLPDVAETPAPGTPAEGICQATDAPFGCYTRVEGGKVEASLCVD